ncbi:MAG: hypothetical protein J6U73_05165, partial [Alistipes sp.]|nr:hypothetical protein [Alistipes sp.]
MKRLFQICAIAALALGFTACEQPSEGTEGGGEVAITLTGDKSEIVADGIDAVVFTALVNGEANDDIMIISLKNNSIVNNNTFTTTVAGDYLFKAVYNNKSSDAFKVTATEPTKPILYLTADKQNIVADGTEVVTFTVTINGEDVTANSTITNLSNNTTIEGNTFTTDTVGEYTFEAKYEEYTSPQISVNATAVPQKSLTLKASKMRIKADGEDKVVFTVLYGEEDVTNSCVIQSGSSLVEVGAEFATTTPGTYKFNALYNEKTSNTVVIDAYDPAIADQYQIGNVCEVNGTKGIVYAVKTNSAGTRVYIVSLDEALLQWSTENVNCNCISNGYTNTYDPFDERYCRIEEGVRDINNYPAFKWCMEHGEAWFLPSSDELRWLWSTATGGNHTFNCEEITAFNKILTDNGGSP